MSESVRAKTHNVEAMQRYMLQQVHEISSELQWFKEEKNLNQFTNFVEILVTSLINGGKLIIFGNGGSAAEASHIAAEFVSKCVTDAGPWPALALGDSTSVVTAIANDYGFENIYVRQIHGFARANDVVLGLTTSGKSKNVLEALSAAKDLGCYVSLWTSIQFEQEPIFVDYVVRSPSGLTPRSQEFHLFLGHLLAELCETRIIERA